MTQHIVYAYAIGTDFSDIASALTERLNAFIASRRWICPEIWTVDQHTPEDWDLGLNVALPNLYEETPGWYADIEVIVTLCIELRRDFGCDFVIGIADNRTGCGEDIIEIDSDRPDYDYLRKFIGSEPPS